MIPYGTPNDVLIADRRLKVEEISKEFIFNTDDNDRHVHTTYIWCIDEDFVKYEDLTVTDIPKGIKVFGSVCSKKMVIEVDDGTRAKRFLQSGKKKDKSREVKYFYTRCECGMLVATLDVLSGRLSTINIKEVLDHSCDNKQLSERISKYLTRLRDSEETRLYLKEWTISFIHGVMEVRLYII